jgi:hypothetical protein
MTLLQAGIDRSVIALWLGHESVETTQIYLDADLALKEKSWAKPSKATNASALKARGSIIGFPERPVIRPKLCPPEAHPKSTKAPSEGSPDNEA